MITNQEVFNNLRNSFSILDVEKYCLMRSSEYNMLLNLLQDCSDSVREDRKAEINETEYCRNWWYDKFRELVNEYTEEKLKGTVRDDTNYSPKW